MGIERLDQISIFDLDRGYYKPMGAPTTLNIFSSQRKRDEGNQDQTCANLRTNTRYNTRELREEAERIRPNPKATRYALGTPIVSNASNGTYLLTFPVQFYRKG